MFRLAQGRRVLVIAPHTDDGEFGCGGTVARAVEEGAIVFCVAFSAAEESVPDGLPRDVLRDEFPDAVRELGVLPHYARVLGYPVRQFPQHRQLILEELLRLRDELQPELVFMPATGDTHQDHQVLSAEGFRAFKGCSILGYELPWNHISFPTDCFVELLERYVERKVRAVRSYASQMGRDYVDEAFIRGWARTRGAQIGTVYAEAFHVIRWVWR